MTQTITTILAGIAALLPLLSFLFISFFGKKEKGAKLAIFNSSISFILSAILFVTVWNQTPVHAQLAWFTLGSFKLTAGILLNNLSVLMMMLVSGIALLVHVYSVEYMKHDPYLHRYWAYLGLFCFSMMSLVISDSLLLIYMFWELVGFSSYLLIGFWFTRDTASQAAKKAFIMNRIGDLGFLTGLMIVFTQFKTFDLVQLFGEHGLVSQSVIQNGSWIIGSQTTPAVWLTIAGVAFFLGAVAKSAQFPLHTWLPDAMEGPTSVSSLIHAATMVAAGVFLIARVYPVFDDTVLMIMTVIGVFTAFMAASIALVQNDIKKILAFSTISQLGFMMLAMGTGAPDAGLFHLTTHAFFKCLLFLAAGSVIHQLHHFKEKEQMEFDHQDIRNMGGLKKVMPVTFLIMLVGSLALAGIPFTSGYLSKDTILISAFNWSDTHAGLARLVPYLAMLTSWITAFYISRLIFKVFFGEFKFVKIDSVHESPSTIRIPLLILGFFCLFPVFSINPFSAEHVWILNGLSTGQHAGSPGLAHVLIPLIVTVVSAGLIYFAYTIYVKKDKSREHASGHNPLYQFIYNQWYFDKIYQLLFVRPLGFLASLTYTFDRIVVDGIVLGVGKIGLVLASIADFTDRYVVDATVNMFGSISKSIGNFTRQFQSGRLQHYMITMMILVLTFFILKYFSQAI